MRSRAVTLVLALVLGALAAACSKHDDAHSTTSQNQGGLTREQYVQVEVDTDCGWIKTSGEPKDREKSRDEALAKLGKTRTEYNLSKGAFMNDQGVRGDIEKQVAECYRAAGFEQVDDPNGEKVWQKAD